MVDIYMDFIWSKPQRIECYLLAVHTANSICMESKKKNITKREMEAPKGKHRACMVSRVANLSATHIEFMEIYANTINSEHYSILDNVLMVK